jgi:hypothetical protein
MNQYYKVTEVLRDSLYEDGIVNNVTTGDIFNVDLNKTTIFPLSHIIVNNTQLEVGKRLIASLRRGNLYDMGFRLNGSISFEAFADRFENKLVGWTITLNVETANNTTIC